MKNDCVHCLNVRQVCLVANLLPHVVIVGGQQICRSSHGGGLRVMGLIPPPFVIVMKW